MHTIFGVKHLIIVAVCAVLIAVLSVLSRKLKFKTVAKALFGVGIVSEIIKIFYYIVTNEAKYGGLLPKTDLPFHLCSIQIIFIAIVVISNNDKLKRFILSFMVPSCLFGGIAAIFLATSSSLNGLFVITGQYFLYHVAITVFAIYLLTSKEIELGLKDYFNCLKFLLIMMFFAIYINSAVSSDAVTTNFMYVVNPPQSGLPFLNENHGWLVYIAHYACVILFGVTICYVKPIVNALKAKFSANKVAVLETATTEVDADNE